MDPDLNKFVTESFSSIWSLELLLLLYREPRRAWSAQELVGELRSSDVVVQQSIDVLAAVRLIALEGGQVRYAPETEEQDNLVSRLADEYQKRPAYIRRLIIQGPDEKLKSFSDAFKLTKD